jgi:hypothetical protein
MIQRIQSVYLTLVLLFSLLFFTGAVLNFTAGEGNNVKLMLNGIITDQSGQTLGHIDKIVPLTVILILIALLSLVTIFLYKSRKIQIVVAKAVVASAALLLIAISWYGFNVITTYKLALSPGLKMILPVLILIFSILALRGILSDERLVKSYDRLR